MMDANNYRENPADSFPQCPICCGETREEGTLCDGCLWEIQLRPTPEPAPDDVVTYLRDVLADR